MYRILKTEDLAPNVHQFVIEAPAVARKAQPGQFLIVRTTERGERIPLTVADFDRAAGTVSFVFMEVGKTTREMGLLKEGDSLLTFVGPLGEATHIDNYGTVVCVGGGFGTATLSPIVRAMKEAGNHVITIMGFRNRELMFWEEKLRSFSHELITCTDDGSYGRKALVTEPLKELLEDPARKVDLVVAIGPAIMMKFVSRTTHPFGTKTIVSLNPIMMDGTGMCGACRVSVGGITRFACVDGPDFDAHEVDWDLLLARQKIFAEQEKRALEMWQCQSCKQESVIHG